MSSTRIALPSAHGGEAGLGSLRPLRFYTVVDVEGNASLDQHLPNVPHQQGAASAREPSGPERREGAHRRGMGLRPPMVQLWASKCNTARTAPPWCGRGSSSRVDFSFTRDQTCGGQGENA